MHIKKQIKKYILLAVLIIYSAFNTGLAGDFYSEADFDIFNTELNPVYIDKNKNASGEFELKKFIKEKLNSRKEQKKIEEEKRLKRRQEIEKKRAEKKAADEMFVSKRKKPLTNRELERELIKEQNEKDKAEQKLQEKEQNLTLIEKIFHIKQKNKKSKSGGQEDYSPPENPNINLTADTMEYFPERSEIEARGNAKTVFKAQNAKIEADKIIYNYDRNILTAFGEVVLRSSDSVTEGGFLRLDLTKPQGWLENPLTKSEDIMLEAKEAVIYADKIEEFDGKGKFFKDDVIEIGGDSFGSYLTQGGLFEENNRKINNAGKGIYKIKAKKIIIDAKDGHDIITIKNASVYLKNHKAAIIPSIKIVSNKTHSIVETNIPEFGSHSKLGTFFGPAVVLNMPRGAVLKLAPIAVYSDKRFGFGGIARYRSETNMTEIAYGTAEKNLIFRGRQRLAQGLFFNYSKYSNQSEWFLGARMPKYAADLTYSRSDYVKDLDLTFSQLYSAGLYVDNIPERNLHNTHSRFRWMTQIYKPVFEYKNKETDGGIRLGITAQTAATVYSQGNTLGLFRIGPSLETQIGRWKQTLVYFQTASAGESPFEFDRYRYGKSNVILMESLKLHKYLSVGYLASIAMNSKYRHDYHHDDILQESRFMAAIGPEYTKLLLGYDAVRHTFMMTISMLIGTKDSDIEFKKAVINNPEKFGQEQDKNKKPKRKSYRKYVKDSV